MIGDMLDCRWPVDGCSLLSIVVHRLAAILIVALFFTH